MIIMLKKIARWVPRSPDWGLWKRGLFGPPLRVGQIGWELYISYATPS